MTAPMRSGSPEWNSSAHVYTRAQMTSALRAALIALVLLAILAVIVLF
ncbi:MAG TPA: hypothetical protein VH496_04795 [Mycobacterium sp.]|jgi:hypothetical protein